MSLKAIRDLISDPKNWTQAAFARDEKGNIVNTQSPLATCWCVQGACMKVLPDCHERIKVCSRLYKASRRMGHESLSALNDSTNHKTVMILFDEAIKDEEANHS